MRLIEIAANVYALYARDLAGVEYMLAVFHADGRPFIQSLEQERAE